MKNVGIVMRDLAPQLEILSHLSTGGFLSHYGWNSCIESITMEVPIEAWPMHLYQSRNTCLVTQVLKASTVVRDWNRCHELTTTSTIANGLRKLKASNQGDEMRKRAAELGTVLQGSMAEGRASCTEFDSFVAHITRHHLGSDLHGCCIGKKQRIRLLSSFDSITLTSLRKFGIKLIN